MKSNITRRRKILVSMGKMQEILGNVLGICEQLSFKNGWLWNGWILDFEIFDCEYKPIPTRDYIERD